LANQVQSHLFLAHVRASTGTAISRNNSHPFVVDNWSFMHNGLVGGFEKVRKKADMLIPDALYKHRKGATDSEAFFLNALGQGLEYDPKRAIAETVKVFEQLSPITPHLRLSIAFSDGKKLYAVRYASDSWAPSIYYRRYKQNDSWAIVSEPFDENHNGWTRMESNSFCIFDKKGVIIQTLI
jgi:glutamine amidotransferase